MKSEDRTKLIGDVIGKVNDDVIKDIEGRTTTRGRFSALIVVFLFLSTGCVFAYTSPALPDVVRHSFRLSSDQQSWVCSIINVGAFVATLTGGHGVQLIGRKMCLLLTMVLFVLGWLLITAANGFTMLLAGRFVCGMCTGLFYMLAPGYLAEITTAKVRASICAYSTLHTDSGLLLMHFTGMFLSWRHLAILCMIVLVVNMLMLLYVPESPRWLLTRGRIQEARETLCWLRGINDVSSLEVEAEFRQIRRHLDRSATCGITVRQLWSKEIRLPILISFATQMFQLLTGGNYVWYYTLSIFEDSGVPLNPHLQTNLFGVAGVVGCVISIFVLGRFGRRQVLMATASLVASSLFALGYFFWMTRDPDTAAVTRERLYWLPLTSMFIYQLSYSMGWGPLPFTIMNELLPTRARLLASSLICAVSWLFVLVITVSAAYFAQNTVLGHHGLFWMFAVCSVLSVPFVFFFLPETKGRTLEEMEDYYLR